MRCSRAAAPAVALLLAVTACSDGGLDPAAEEELLEDVILTLDDLPDGFVESEDQDGDNSNQGAFDDCSEEADLDPDAVDESKVAEAGPATFEIDNGDSFGRIVVELSSVSDDGPVRNSFEAIEDDDLIDCFADAIAEEAEEDGEPIEDLEVRAIDAAVDGDISGALQFSGVSQGFDIVAEAHGVLVGDHLISIEATSVNGGLDDQVVEDAFDAMIERFDEAS